ncbi:SCO family protein [Sulfurospirillum arcachonense]|uniref:SCO family protein n=1 Tax=Sulfurospirillum arcachonense TaxID=57666 RepID=UPI0004681AC6|nr:SCO family protein [Sulfurospirillum arcachonense]
MKRFYLVLFLAFFISSIYASDEKVGTYEQLGKYVPLDLVFVDENNQSKTLGEFMSNKPTVISVNYFNCPGICGPQIDGMTRSLDRMELIEGKEYKALTISFVKKDTPKNAKDFKKNHINIIRKNFDENAWNFLTTKNQKTIDTLTQALGYEYKKIINKQGFVDYIHPAGLVILSPDGKITRYLSGIKYLSFDLKMALLEASKGKVRPTIARALSFCFSFDPENSKYVLASNKILATIILSMILGFFMYMLIKGRKRGDNHDE